MNLFELPNVFMNLARGQPPQDAPADARPILDVLKTPVMHFYSPPGIWPPPPNYGGTNRVIPVVPGNGGNVTMGLGPIEYGDQATWDRSKTYQAGPVREFFRQTFDPRVKHV